MWFCWITLELWICCIAMQFRQKYILQFFLQSWSERKCDIFLYRKLNFWIFNDYIMTVWIFFFHWILRTIDKKKKHSYMYLIKELIKVFDGHIHLYILQSLSSMFANIGMCCVHIKEYVIDIVNSSILNKSHRRRYCQVSSKCN